MSKFSSMNRRQTLSRLAALGELPYLGSAGAARAGTFPSPTISVLVPDSGGGTFDTYVRKFSQIMAKQSSVNIAPISMPGAGGRAAVFNLLHDKPDGYTIGMPNVPGLLTSQYDKNQTQLDLSILTWVGNLGRDLYGLAVSAKSPIRNIADLKKQAAQKPISFSSTGFGSTDYFATRVFVNVLGLNYRQILGYTGSAPTMVAVARGDVDAVVHSFASLRAMEKSGLIRTIFVFQNNAKLSGIDDATTIGKPELGEIFQWRPVAAPPGVAPDVVAKLSQMLMSAAHAPEAIEWAKMTGADLFPLDHVNTAKMIQAQQALVQKWKASLI